MNRSMGLMIILAGGALLLLGLLVYSGAFNAFGRLPGDIRIETERTKLYFPWVSMLVLSALFSLVWSLLRRFF